MLKGNGLTSVEVNTGGFIPSPHCHVDLLLSSEQARADYLGEFSSRGMELTGLNCNGNPLNPLPGVGPKHADDMRRSIELAGALGINNIVCMSGTPGSDPDAKYPSWVVNPWDGVYMDVLDYQWDVAAKFWTEIDALARANDTRMAIEMHPHNLVFSPVTLKKLVDLVGATQRRRGDGPVAPDVAGHGHRGLASSGWARWCSTPPRRTPRSPRASTSAACSTPRSGGCPPTREGKVPTGYGFWCNSWPENPGWRFVAVGIGHDVEYWTEFLRALAEIDPDMAVNIEHEDADYGRLEGLALAAENLRAAAAKM